MPNAKTATLSFRIEPGLKDALRIVAEQEHRSVANMVEVMIREYCGRAGVAIAEQSSSVRTKQTTKTNQKKSSRVKKTT